MIFLHESYLFISIEKVKSMENVFVFSSYGASGEDLLFHVSKVKPL